MKRSLMMAAAVIVLGAGFLTGCYVVATPRGLGIGLDLPAMNYIAGTSIRTVSGVPGDVFYYDNMYWRWHGGRWWRSTVWNRGWLVVTTVPRVFLTIPRAHRAYRVVRYHPRYKKPVKVKTLTPRVKTPVVKRPVVRRPVVRTPVKTPGARRPVTRGHVKSAVKRAPKPAPPGHVKKAVKKKKGGKSED